jgi:hypothetical protein
MIRTAALHVLGISPYSYGADFCESALTACCRIVTVQTIRNGLVSPDAKLSSFAAAVYAFSESDWRVPRVYVALRSIVAESL